MNTAIIKTGGKQYVVKEGTVLNVEKLEAEDGATVSFDVLFTDNGSEAVVGTPLVSGAKVSATVVSGGREKKKIVVKYKAKSRYYKKRGHRQPFTKVKIGSV